MKILLVEDDIISRRILSKNLKAANHEVVEAKNGHEALEMLHNHPIQFVISDWQMPEMDGLELCRQIRNAGFENYIYIVMITARVEKKDLVEVLQAGADDYIPKPVHPEELMARVQTGIRMITLEKRYMKVQRHLISSRDKLKLIFDAIQEEIVAIDSDGNIMSVNQSCLKWVGKDFSDTVGNSFRSLFDDYLADAVQQAFDDKKRQNVLMAISGKNGVKADRQVSILPIYGSSKKVFLVILVMKDLTEERRHAEEIKALNERLVKSSLQLETKNKKLECTLNQLEETQTHMVQSEKMASIGQLAAGVAHEINNPTGFVSSNLKTLGDYKVDIEGLIQRYQALRDHLMAADEMAPLGAELGSMVKEITSYEQEIDVDFLLSDTTALIGDCREGTERIKKIVMDLKDFAHPGDDQLQLVDVNAGISSTLNVVNNEIKYKAEVNRSFGDIPAILGYPQQLNQVFMNILVNAAHAIEEEGSISISTREINGFIEVDISDTGCGIPAENLSKIFDPFFTTKEVGKGTGLGMHIVYNIVAKHGGTIEAKSTVGKGTTFSIRIPIEPPEISSESPQRQSDASMAAPNG